MYISTDTATSSGIGVAENLFALTDIPAAAHDWDATKGLALDGTKINTWTDQIGSTDLQMSGVNRADYVNTGGFDTVDMTAGSQVMSLDGSNNSSANLPALDGLTGYVAVSFKTTLATTGALISLVESRRGIYPRWSGDQLYIPDNTDSLKNLGQTPIPLDEWGVFTLNARNDRYIARYQGVELYNVAAKNYNFDNFMLNKRFGGAFSSNAIRRIFVASDGLTDADNLSVEGLLAADLANAP